MYALRFMYWLSSKSDALLKLFMYYITLCKLQLPITGNRSKLGEIYQFSYQSIVWLLLPTNFSDYL